jgi:hypothetical protein
LLSLILFWFVSFFVYGAGQRVWSWSWTGYIYVLFSHSFSSGVNGLSLCAQEQGITWESCTGEPDKSYPFVFLSVSVNKHLLLESMVQHPSPFSW